MTVSRLPASHHADPSDRKVALQIVLDLAFQNLADSVEMPDEFKRQMTAIVTVEKLLKE